MRLKLSRLTCLIGLNAIRLKTIFELWSNRVWQESGCQILRMHPASLFFCFLLLMTIVGRSALGQNGQNEHSVVNKKMAFGQVFDEDGAPLKNVAITPCLYDAHVLAEDRNRMVMADDRGNWEWDIQKNPEIYCLRASRTGFMPLEIPVIGGKHQRSVLKFASSVQGYVVDDQDREVEGVTVALVESTSEIAPTPVVSTISDNRGWFELFGVVDTNASLRAWTSTGYSGAVQDNFATSKKPLTIELKPPRRMRLELTDLHRKPLAGARVTLKSWNRSGIFQWSEIAKEDGILIWERAPSGLLAFEIECDGFQTIWQHIQIDHDLSKSIQLRRADDILSNVIDDDSNRPVERFLVIPSVEKLNTLFVPKQELAGWYCGPIHPRNAKVLTRGLLPLESIPFFDHSEVEIVAPGFSRYKFRMDRQTDLKSSSEIRLKRPSTVANTKCLLLQPDGQPAGGTNFMYIAQGGITIATNADPLVTQLQWPYHIFQQTTGTDGSFLLSARPEFEFAAAWNEHGSFAGLTRTLPQQQSVRLTPYAKLELHLNPDSFEPFVRFAVQQMIELDREKSFAKTFLFTPLNQVARGRFVSDRVPAGDIQIVCQSFMPLTKKFESHAIATIQALPNQDFRINLAGSSSIRGQLLVMHDEQQTSEISQRLETNFECVATSILPENGVKIRYIAKSEKDGTFEFVGLRSGKYLLEFNPKFGLEKYVRPGQFTARIPSEVASPLFIADSESVNVGTISLSIPQP